MCLETVLRLQITLKQTFIYSIYLDFTKKEANTGAVLISAVFGTR